MKRKTSNCPLCKGTGRNTLKKDEMIVRRSRSKHNAGQAKRTKRYRDKLKRSTLQPNTGDNNE